MSDKMTIYILKKMVPLKTIKLQIKYRDVKTF